MSITESFCYTAEILYIKYISVKKNNKKSLGESLVLKYSNNLAQSSRFTEKSGFSLKETISQWRRLMKKTGVHLTKSLMKGH